MQSKNPFVLKHAVWGIWLIIRNVDPWINGSAAGAAAGAAASAATICTYYVIIGVALRAPLSKRRLT